jgi:hypothetical protein
VQKRILSLAVIAILLFSLFSWNCTKLDTTDIGSDLLPAVDNVKTFDTILNINSTQGFFSDSSYISKADDYAVGAINNDPLFGRTNANIFMQLKPPFYPYYLGNSGDTINGFGAGLDSIVLCLKYNGFWGDSSVPIHLEVREVNDPNFRDSVYRDNPTNYQPNYTGVSIGSADVDVRTLGNYVKFTNGRDSVRYQIRIKLSPSWAAQLYNSDSTANGPNNAFYSDSVYRRLYNGLAVIANGSGNGLIYANIADTATKIEIHYRRKNQGKLDSVYTSLRLNSTTFGTVPPSNAVDNIIRNRFGADISTPGTDEHYLQAAPGTFVNLNIPGLAGLSNRIIHRAEIIVEQIPANAMLDEALSAPNFLYMDLKDTGFNKWKPVYYDLNTAQIYDPDYKTFIPYIANPIDFQYFGGYRRSKNDQFGNLIKYYNFNISRYVQHLVTDHTYNYDFRMYAPFNLSYPQYSPTLTPYGNNIAFGRVKIGSGSNANYRLRLRIVYSKL